MQISRRGFLIAGSAGALAARVPLLAATPSLEIEIIGLNAYVLSPSDPSAVQVGFIGAAHGKPAAAAPMPKMRLRAAPAGKRPAAVFAASPAGETIITLEGFRTRIEADAQAQLLAAPHAAPAKPPATHPRNPHNAADWRPLHWVPNVAWYASSAKVASDWQSKVAGILELRGGSLEAGMPDHEDGKCAVWAFENGAQTVWQQSIADRMIYRLPLNGPAVTLRQTSLTGGADNVVKLTANGTLRIVIDYPDTTVDQFYPIGTSLDHFKAFYALLADPNQPQIVPVHRSNSVPPKVGGSRPGPYCPPTIMVV
jgi:hypothetical protein